MKMKLQKILSRFLKLHNKEIDLSLDRINHLCNKLGKPQNKVNAISIVGTNGKNSTIQACYSILKEANINCNVFTSPHIEKVNERFIFNNKEIDDYELVDLLEEVEKINDDNPITFFEILTACFFYKASQFPKNINLIEAGLFHRFDATNILKKNLASIVTSISLDHLDWLPKNERTIEKIVFEKTSSLLNSNIIVAKQNNQSTMNKIKETISKNKSKKFFFNDDYSFAEYENDFFYYEDKFGGLKLPKPNILGQFQLENISTAIATTRILDLGVKEEHIRNGIQKINNIARLQEIKSGRLKNLVQNNLFLISGDHNEDGARVLNEYLRTLNCRKHIIIGMMKNKDHEKYIRYFNDVYSITTVDIPNQQNAISGKNLEKKFNNLSNVKYKKNIVDAIKSINFVEGDLLLITGSFYLCSEVLKIN